MASQPNVFLTPEQYLAIEEKAEEKSEYFDGEMFAMSGVSFAHDTIVGNLLLSLLTQLKGSPCRAHTSDLRVAVSPKRTYVYPDVSISCQDPRVIRRGTDNLLNPVALIEVLSPTTELHDRGRKFRRYTQMKSLKEYLLVSQDEVLVERFQRRDVSSEWIYSSASSLDDSITLVSAPATLKLSDVYDSIFPPTSGMIREEDDGDE